jgi:hypothetical protein
MKAFVTLLCLLLGTAVSASGIIVISSEPNYQRYPAACFGPDTFLVVWQDWRDSQPPEIEDDVYAARVTLQGEVLEPLGIPIAVKKNVVEAFGPLVWDGNNWFVGWGEDTTNQGFFRLWGARVSRDGVVLDPGGKLLLNDIGPQLNARSAFDGQNYFLIWEAGFGQGIYGARLTRDLVSLDPDGLLLWAGPYAIPRVAYDGQNYCVVWGDFTLPWDPQILAGRVRPDGVVLDTVPIEVFPRETRPDAENFPEIAYGGGVYLIVASRDTANSYPDIIGARISPQGELLDSTSIMISRMVQRHAFRHWPRLAYNGRFFQAVWECVGGSLLWVIEGVRVEPSGRVLDTVQVGVVREVTGEQKYPGIAYGRDGRFLLVWDHRAPYVADVYGCFVDTSGRQVVGVEEQTSSVNPVPLRFELAQNTPNPWASGTRISYSLSAPGEVSLAIYDALGRRVRAFSPHAFRLTPHEVFWDGRDDSGRRVPSGVYFYRLQAGAFSDTKRMVVIR